MTRDEILKQCGEAAKEEARLRAEARDLREKSRDRVRQANDAGRIERRLRHRLQHPESVIGCAACMAWLSEEAREAMLTRRYLAILRGRRAHPPVTYREIGEGLNLSPSRVQSLYRRAVRMEREGMLDSSDSEPSDQEAH